MYFQYPDVAVSLLYNSILYASFYSITTTFPSLFADTYGLDESQVSLCYSNGCGGILGSFLSGKIMDRDYRIMKKRMGLNAEKEARGTVKLDFPIKRERQRSFVRYSLRTGGHTGESLASGTSGAAVCCTAIFNVYSTLMVDLFPGDSASITASNNLSRCIFSAIATVTVNPEVAALGSGCGPGASGCGMEVRHGVEEEACGEVGEREGL
ncbi:hypothetical protein BC937DRAFT_86558 [Endogone sp. FLAS-F59071]|nr:hypothetical protein BC937DRAFT_86558 [Endogone sp. FLAS-F59071]|eukprot:RUS20019.1 hypothetical protein BC937DRAFT_86558 [Endogone sp. FLAS-F59071]